ncbi:MAG: serine/threonine protein kinase [Proteobacteria bacterium]|nr:serine/threonine protein kinase [Pseudomonadota bacterium]
MDYGRALPSGTLIAGEWRVERVLGEGGFGVTYEVHNSRTGEHAALKEYMPVGYCNRDFISSRVTAPSGQEGEVFRWGLERFMNEAETLARLEHPSIVRVAGFFEANGTAYMALAYETGGTFRDWLDKLGRRPSQEELDELLKPLVDALTQVHSLFLLHRDIKPDNIMMRADGTPVLIDFGAARSAIAAHTETLGRTFPVLSDGYSTRAVRSE